MAQILPTPLQVDLNDVQGDIITGLPKRVEDFLFFTIENVENFRKVVGSPAFLDLITTAANNQEIRTKIRDLKLKSQQRGEKTPLIPLAAVNIAFTQTGLNKLGITDDMADEPFKAGQLARAGPDILEDRGTVVDGVFVPDWHNEFKGDIHGLILIAADGEQSLPETVEKVERALVPSIKIVHRVNGKVRPDSHKGHEHFGWLDGVSQPAIRGINTPPLPGQQEVDPGVILVGHPGDPKLDTRPAWAKNGSFLVYRHLEQLVPEFHQFLRDNALNLLLELDDIEKGADLLGSRLVGRWKSGAPIELTPAQDDSDLGKDRLRNNNFKFDKDEDGALTQVKCPFAAHIRKTNPRSDIPNSNVAAHTIHRAGIPFGDELSDTEGENKKTEQARGLSFVCYQSSILQGFEFQQQIWANNEDFVVKGQSGHDPIVGQNGNDARSMLGFDPTALEKELPLETDFVVSKGGAYFFSPSISALRDTIGKK